MAGIREIRRKISSIKSTQKITRAMQMVAASKIRKAQERMLASRPYAKCVRDVIVHLTERHLDVEHPYLQERSPKRVGFVVVSSDRGLCAGLNSHLFHAAIAEMLKWEEQGVGVDICTIGNKAEVFFKRHKAYEAKKLDRIFIVYNQFLNTMNQIPKVEMLLPVIASSKTAGMWKADYLYEPAPELLLDGLLKRYVESLVYQGVVENVACEQAARMVAMKNATDNAGEIIENLQLIYNKARQAAITKELSEIVAGAAAV